jgi:hypothetical protein
MFGYFLTNTNEMLQHTTVLHTDFGGTNFGQLNMAQKKKVTYKGCGKIIW